MADKPFRILLDVTDLCLENFKYVWINVSPRELKTISDFKKCALNKINLEREDVQLFIRDGLLLDEETILVLREDDTVKIKYKNPHLSNLVKESLKESANFSRKRNFSECNVSDEDTISKRYKPEVINLSSNRWNGSNFVEKKSKKEKRRKQKETPMNLVNCSTLVEKNRKETESSVNFENCHSTLVEEDYPRKKNHSKKKGKKKSIALNQTGTDLDSCKTDSFFSFATEDTQQKQNENNTSPKTILVEPENGIVLSNDPQSNEEFSLHQNKSSELVVIDFNSVGLNNKNLQKKRRKRRRKRKPPAVLDVSGSCKAIDNLKSFSENVNDGINKKHILYLSPDKNKETNCLDDGSKFQNPSTDTFVLKEDNFTDIQSLSYPKMSTPAQSINCTVPDWQFSLMPSKSSNLSYSENSSVLNDKSTTKNTSQSTKEIKSEKPLYGDLPDLTSLPVVGTYIAYKALELDESYSPTVTDYREGIVERINPETEEIEIRLNKAIVLPGRTGKFENLGEDEVPDSIVKKYDVLKWCDLITPKLFSYLPE